MPVFDRWASVLDLDDLFVLHYAQMVRWAEDLVRRDRAAAEDLVQDTYVRVALRKPDLRGVGNLEGYLFVTMRNVHLSQMRRRAARPEDAASVLDYESAVATLIAVDSHPRRRVVHEELMLVARYACIRKPTSKAASALILRFFHGYYPSEICRVLNTTLPAVDARLRIARAEAQNYLIDPNRLRAFEARPLKRLGAAAEDVDVVAAARESIFDSRTGVCLAARDFDRLYTQPASDPLPAAALSHIVSCRACLDALNQRFGLPLLKDRDPSDMLGRGKRPGGTSRGGQVGNDPKTELRTRIKDALEDRPKELRIAVNGLFVGSQTVGGRVNEQRVKVLIPERVGFVEVFSEHGTCLLYLDVHPPPDGPAEQQVVVELSDGRRLSAVLAFHEASPVLDIIYEDASLQDAPQVLRERSDRYASAARVGGRFLWMGWPSWLRLLATLSMFAAAVGAAWVSGIWPTPRVSAAELLRDTHAVESVSAGPGVATHRLLTVEERVRPASAVVRRQEIEVWHDPARGLKVRRVFDGSRVVAGLWLKADGTGTVYRTGERPSEESSQQTTGPVTSRDIWRHDPSADDFLSLVKGAGEPEVDENNSRYIVTYRATDARADGLIEVSLTIAKADRRATAETVVIQEQGQTREFTFSETRREQLPVSTVRPGIFDPEPALVMAMTPVAPVATVRPLTAAPPPAASPATAPSRAQFDQFELDATYRLYRAHLWVGQQAEVVRTEAGLHVTANASSEDMQANLARSFEELTRATPVILDISLTAADATATVPVVDLNTLGALPAYAALQSLFRDVPVGRAREELIRTFASSVLERLAQRQDRFGALTTLINRWPEDRLRDMPLESVVTWQVMVQEHAEAIRQQTELLRARIAPLLKVPAPAGPPRSAAPSLTTVPDAADTVAQMVTLAADQDDLLRNALTPCRSNDCPSLDVQRLMQSFGALEASASRFGRFYLKVGRNSGK